MPPVTHYTRAPALCTIHILIFLHFIWNKFHVKEQWIRGVSVLAAAADTAAYTDFLSPWLASWLWKIRDRLQLGTLASPYWENDKEHSPSPVCRFCTDLVFILQLKQRTETMKQQQVGIQCFGFFFFLNWSDVWNRCIWLRLLVLNCDKLKQTFAVLFCYETARTFIFCMVFCNNMCEKY